VSPQAESARLLLLSRLAQRWNRDLLVRSALEQSAKFSPPFAPTYRELVVQYATRADWDKSRRAAETSSLISSVRAQGDEALAVELEGLSLVATGNAAKAADRFAAALKMGRTSIDLRLEYATALRLAGKGIAAEQALWKLI